jgi:hypothetical protein
MIHNVVDVHRWAIQLIQLQAQLEMRFQRVFFLTSSLDHAFWKDHHTSFSLIVEIVVDPLSCYNQNHYCYFQQYTSVEKGWVYNSVKCVVESQTLSTSRCGKSMSCVYSIEDGYHRHEQLTNHCLSHCYVLHHQSFFLESYFSSLTNYVASLRYQSEGAHNN